MSSVSQSTPKPKKANTPERSRSARAGLVFPVGRMHRQLKDGQYSRKIGIGACVYIAAVVEYLAAEVLEMAGNCAQEDGKVRIIPRHIMKAIRGDQELNLLLKNAIICDAGVMPSVAYALVKKSKVESTETSVV